GPIATNLGFLEITDASVSAVHDGSLGYHYGLLWPRKIYGFAIEELSAQNARAIAMDIIFSDLRLDHPAVQMTDDSWMQSDDFLALQMRQAGNVIIADTIDLTPPDLFATNALALGDISTTPNKDSDGVLRRTPAFRREWHPLFHKIEADPGFGVDLSKA